MVVRVRPASTACLRAMTPSWLRRARSASASDEWSSVLKSASAFEMYNREYDRIDPRLIIRFLLFDRDFPRSILFCVVRTARSLQKITGSDGRSFENSPEKSLGRLRSDLEYTEVKEVYDIGLHEYLDRLQMRLNEIGVGLYNAYFRFEN